MPMRDATLKSATLHARLPGFRRRVENSRALVGEWLSHCRKPYIALSGGKDSTVAMHLVRSVCPEVVAVWSDDEWHLPETLAYLSGVADLLKVAGQQKHHDLFTAWDGPAGERPDELEVDRVWMPQGFAAWVLGEGFDGVALGLRSSENRYRQTARKVRGLMHRTTAGVWQCWPIGDWSVMDVWGYLVSRQVPYNAAYDVMDAAGMALEAQRVGPLLNSRADGQQLQVLRRLWPQVYQAFVARYPQAARFG